jgi:hypothetical protein
MRYIVPGIGLAFGYSLSVYALYMRVTFRVLLFAVSAVTASAARVDCASVPTVGDMVALGSEGCRLDSPAAAFIQRDFVYSAESTNGNPVPNPFSLPSAYFGGHIISGLRAAAGDTLIVRFTYTYETGTDLLSMPSAAVTSPDPLPAGTTLTTELCRGSAFVNDACSGALSMLSSAATGVSQLLHHTLASVGTVGGVLGFRQVLTLPGGSDGQEFALQTSGVIARTAVPEPLPLATSAVALVALLVMGHRRQER